MYDMLVHTTNKPVARFGSARPGVMAEGLSKQFGDLWALRELNLQVPPGTVLGLLGHNGAGKTTAIRILTTLSQPTAGRAEVAGFDVVGDASKVRTMIGVAAQQATADGLLNARLNLETLPNALQWVAAWNPVSVMVAAVRELFGNRAVPLTKNVWPLHHPVISAWMYCAVILAVAAPGALRRYSTRTAD